MKTEIIAKICYICQLHRLAYFLNRKRKRIITFHNVLDDDVFVANVANGVSNSLSSFKKIIDEIEKRFSFSLDLDDPSTITITFDDGYSNQVEIAAPYLISKNIPAYLFVTGQLIIPEQSITDCNIPETLIIDKLLHWISYAPIGEYELDYKGNIKKFTIDELNRTQIWSNIIWPLFLQDSSTKGNDLFDSLNRMYHYSKILELLPTKYKKQRLKGVSTDQLQKLKEAGWQIGWHTMSHYPVSRLSTEDKCQELMPAPVCDSKVFSFPYGGLSDADEECIENLKNREVESAVSNINHGNSQLGKWYRSRISLSSQTALLHFELSGLKYMLKYKKLLPNL